MFLSKQRTLWKARHLDVHCVPFIEGDKWFIVAKRITAGLSVESVFVAFVCSNKTLKPIHDLEKAGARSHIYIPTFFHQLQVWPRNMLEQTGVQIGCGPDVVP